MSQTDIPSESLALLAQLPVPLALLSLPSETIIYLNPAFSERFQYPPENCLAKPLKQFLSFAKDREGKDEDSKASRQGILQFPGAQAHAVSVSENDILLQVGKNDVPQYRVLAIEPVNPDASLAKAHHDFLSTVSHEFRTPLTSIKGFADTLLKYGEQLDREQQRRFIHIMKDQADRLIRMVEALLDVSKNGDGRLDITFRPIQLRPLLERIVQSVMIKTASAKSGAQHPVVIDVPGNLPPLWADSDRLEQVLTNLIDNAVKYSEPDKTVTIRAYECSAVLPAESHGAPVESVAVDVIDEGIGISEENLEKLFTRFYRIESLLTQQVEGTGLGLYITKSLTRAMGGDISVQSALGKGSTFHLAFPVATLEKQAAYHRGRYAENSVTGNGEETSYAG